MAKEVKSLDEGSERFEKVGEISADELKMPKWLIVKLKHLIEWERQSAEDIWVLGEHSDVTRRRELGIKD